MKYIIFIYIKQTSHDTSVLQYCFSLIPCKFSEHLLQGKAWKKTIAHYLKNPYAILIYSITEILATTRSTRHRFWNWICKEHYTLLYPRFVMCVENAAHTRVAREVLRTCSYKTCDSCRETPVRGGTAQLGRTGPLELERGYQKIPGKFAISRS